MDIALNAGLTVIGIVMLCYGGHYLVEGGVGTPALAVFAKTIMDSHLIIPANHLLANNPSYGIFFHENFFKNSPKLVLRFLEHHKKACYLLRNSQDEAAEIISKTLTILNSNKEYAKDVLEISPKYCISLSELNIFL